MHRKLPVVEGGNRYLEKTRNISNDWREEKSIYKHNNNMHAAVLPTISSTHRRTALSCALTLE